MDAGMQSMCARASESLMAARTSDQIVFPTSPVVRMGDLVKEKCRAFLYAPYGMKKTRIGEERRTGARRSGEDEDEGRRRREGRAGLLLYLLVV
eukprot:4562589-Pyramimonas_sp.AAC.1